MPPSCGKLQSWRGLGVITSAARPAGARPAASPRRTLGIALAALALAAPAAAQEPAGAPTDLIVSSTLERIVAAQSGGAAAAVPIAADAAAPQGDQIIVSVRFTNASDHLIDSIRITSPVPAEVQYVANSAGGPGSDVLFSVDNGRSFARPEELTIAASDGGVRAAVPSEYTHVRWVLRAPLDAGATGIARFRGVPR